MLVKLEDAAGLADLLARFKGDQNAWFLLARCFMAYKQRRLDDAAAVLHQIVRSFPAAGCTLTYQDELPPGMFGHLEYAEGSADELYVAVSEAAVILDENCGDSVSPLSDWIANDAEVSAARAREEAAAGASSPRAPEPAEAPADEDLFFSDIESVDELLSALARAAGENPPDTQEPTPDDPTQGR